jgi:hypothetical protein
MWPIHTYCRWHCSTEWTNCYLEHLRTYSPKKPEKIPSDLILRPCMIKDSSWSVKCWSSHSHQKDPSAGIINTCLLITEAMEWKTYVQVQLAHIPGQMWIKIYVNYMFQILLWSEDRHLWHLTFHFGRLRHSNCTIPHTIAIHIFEHYSQLNVHEKSD